MPENQIEQNVNQVTDFTTILSKEYQDNPSIALFKGKSPDDFAKAFVNAQSLIGKKTIEKIPEGMVKVPGDNSTDEERSSYFRAIGVPENPDNYESPDLGKDFRKDEKLEQWFKATAHKHGMTPTQFKGLYQDFVENQKLQVSAVGESTKKLYGDKFDEAMKVANRAVSKLPDEIKKQIEPYIGFDPILTQVLHSFGGLLGESQSPDVGGSSTGSMAELEALIKKANELTYSPDYSNRSVWEKANEFQAKAIELGKKLGVPPYEITRKIVERNRK